jgi:hypothetical protein
MLAIALAFLATALLTRVAPSKSGLDRGSSAEMAAQRIKLDLLILDEYLLDRRVADLSTQLHRARGLERLSTLLLNAAGDHSFSGAGFPALSSCA